MTGEANGFVMLARGGGFTVITRLAATLFVVVASVATADEPLFNDSHFHLTNYVQVGSPVREFLDRTMGTQVGRVALFGIPLQQTWSYENSGDYAPTYYLQSDAPLYYYSWAACSP